MATHCGFLPRVLALRNSTLNRQQRTLPFALIKSGSISRYVGQSGELAIRSLIRHRICLTPTARANITIDQFACARCNEQRTRRTHRNVLRTILILRLCFDSFPASACCAPAAAGQAATPPRRPINSRRLMGSPYAKGHTLPSRWVALCIAATFGEEACWDVR